MYRPFNLKNTFRQRLVMVLLITAAAMVMIGPAQAAKAEYTISFTDTSTDAKQAPARFCGIRKLKL
jgi:hypothetical protein